MRKPKSVKRKASTTAATLDDIRNELRTCNRLMIATLALGGVRQTDIADVIGKVDSAVSEMFPKGLLRKLTTQHLRNTRNGEESAQ